MSTPGPVRKRRAYSQHTRSWTPTTTGKNEKKVCAVEWRGPCCGGLHFWGHGPGHNTPYGHKYMCGVSGCRKWLPKLPPGQQAKRHASLQADIADYHNQELALKEIAALDVKAFLDL